MTYTVQSCFFNHESWGYTVLYTTCPSQMVSLTRDANLVLISLTQKVWKVQRTLNSSHSGIKQWTCVAVDRPYWQLRYWISNNWIILLLLSIFPKETMFKKYIYLSVKVTHFQNPLIPRSRFYRQYTWDMIYDGNVLFTSAS